MISGRVSEWKKLPVSLSELCLETTLRCGQSFRWRKSSDDEWSCALRGRIFTLKQNSSTVFYRTTLPTASGPLTPPPSLPLTPKPSTEQEGDGEDESLAYLKHYLNLAPNLARLYQDWSAADKNFEKKAPKFTGIRILRQDAWEALVGFICSSNNNIVRISQMVEKLCIHYGRFIGNVKDEAFYDMPSPADLTDPKVESHLRQLGFGYRAKYIYQTAKIVTEEHEPGWLDGLRNPESPAFGNKARPAGAMSDEGREGYRQAHGSLLELQGVGPKVADCVCLMGLGWGEAVPVDTHFWQIAQRDYRFGRGKHASLTKATYDAVGNHFRKIWGQEAGWAHSVLFAADLKVFSERLRIKVEAPEDDSVNGEADPVKKEEVEGKETLHVTDNAVVVTDTTVKHEPDVHSNGDGKRTLEVHEQVAQPSPRKRRKR